jgi:ADP-L-glycero-D-manno-heptose 6-epimerase
MASLVRQFHVQARDLSEIRMFAGSDRFTLDFIHVDDVANVTMHFFDRPSLNGIYNCGTGKAVSIDTVARIVAARYDHIRITDIPFPASLVGKYQESTRADIGRLRRDSGYASRFMGIEEGIPPYLDVLDRGEG